MRIRFPKLRNMTHALSLSVFIAFKGTKYYILFVTRQCFQMCHKNLVSSGYGKSEIFETFCQSKMCSIPFFHAYIYLDAGGGGTNQLA